MLESDQKACKFIKKRLQHSCFPMNMAKFRRSILETSANGCYYIWNIGMKRTKQNGSHWSKRKIRKIFGILSKGVYILVRKQNFPKTYISYPLIRTLTCAYQEVRNVSFTRNFAYIKGVKVFTGKANPKVKLKCLQRVLTWIFGIGPVIYKRFSTQIKFSKKKVTAISEPLYINKSEKITKCGNWITSLSTRSSHITLFYYR